MYGAVSEHACIMSAYTFAPRLLTGLLGVAPASTLGACNAKP